MKNFYIHMNAGNAVFVKTEEFFKDQGGLTQKWGTGWKKVQAHSIEDARRIGENTLTYPPQS